MRRGGRNPAGRKVALLFISLVFLVFAGYLVYQLYRIQVVDYAVNAELAASQHYKRVTEQPRRGSIMDRNGLELAGTTYVYRIGITPKDVRSITRNITAGEIAESIAGCLNLPVADVKSAMSQTESMYVQLKKDVPRHEADALKKFLSEANVGGVRIDDEPRRYYTNGSLGSQVIGFSRYIDNNLVGQLGVELQYNSVLTGQPGYTYAETDNYGGKGGLPFSVPTSLRAQNGQNVVLNIDINIQKIVQEELAIAVELNDIIDGGTAIVMDPYTGAVLAMADYPYFASDDPAARPMGLDQELWDELDQGQIEYLSANVWRNRAVSDSYEPGSTMKSLTAAMAFEEALSHEKEIFDDAPMQVFDWTISCIYRPGHGLQPVDQSLWRSCNPVFAQLAQRIGIERFYTYLHAFGFMGKTGIDLPAEGTGIFHTNPTELDMVTFSYGESSTVTPIQMAAAYCVFANGGNLVRPSVVRAITDENGALVREMMPETVRKVISESTAARIKDLMKGVVLYGTGSAAYVEGYSVAGKTSTSVDDDGEHTLSFGAIAPAEKPEIVTLVILYKPADKTVTSRAAARASGAIIARTLEYMGVPREYNETDVSRIIQKTEVPDITGLTFAQARKDLLSIGLRAEAADSSLGEGTIIKYQWPAAGEKLHNNGQVYLYPLEQPPEDLVTIPDFIGRNVHECFRLALESNLNINIIGESLGIVAEQNPISAFEAGRQNAPATPAPPDDNAGEETPGEPADQTPVTRIQRGSIIDVRFEQVEEILEEHEHDHEHDHPVDEEES